MKLFLIIFVFCLALQNSYAESIDKITAQQVAESFYYSKNPLKDNISIIKSINHEFKGMITRYTFVFEDNNYVVVSADNSTVPVFSYSKKGNFSENPSSPTYELWMESEYDEWVYYVHTNKVSNNSTIEEWNNLLNSIYITKNSKSVEPMIQTEWGQGSTNDFNCPGYNSEVESNSACIDNCEHCASGCVALAIAQIMNFWQSPDDDFNWCVMPNELISTASNFEEQQLAVAELIADCGDKSEMDYCSGGNCSSSVTMNKAKKALIDDYNYNSEMLHRYRWLTISWKPKMRKSLDQGQPIFYGGEDSDGNGHAFVCDGYENDDFFHFNFGFRGVDDDYFYIKDKDGDPVLHYSKWQEAVFYIEPELKSMVNCIDCTESISINNQVIMNNPYNSFFPQLQWIGLPETYNYDPYFPDVKPFSSTILLVNGETRLEYHDIEAGEINVVNVQIPDLINLHLVATDRIHITNSTITSGSIFSSTIIDCPNDAMKKSSYERLNNTKNQSVGSTNKDNINNGVKIFPNPTNSIVNIESSKEIKTIHILNILGSVELYQEINSKEIEIDLISLNSGVYFIKILREDNETHIHKIIKK